ncbi:hypothetical protein EJV46_04240 [Roseococcus sp. SYP-B2431]|uniref:hypothetical protein n=1 Tax=Roseococcus sp. SYP-B2431 TaxID=2496640 RepID=UPI00103A8F49|nr:hypothetical protein [Roseococcus sp. SYP-B2431]TCH99881.1 hypothetical protein EJV46_04240 [Roseococcus sp. SYP-B2431]
MIGRRVSTKMWLGLGAFTLVGGTAAAQPAPAIPAAPAAQGGEGGEAGGEGGIDPALAETDPVEFLVAMDVIAAHYAAGQDIYRLGETQAAGEMFAHPIAEVYAELEEVLARLGVADFREAMERASALALDRAPLAEVEQAVAAVRAALHAAEAQAPGIGATPKVQAAVIADMADRAALQYEAALREPDQLEPYLDGYGLYRAAADRAARAAPELRAAHLAPVHEAMLDMLAALAVAYPTANRPAAPADSGPLQAAAERLRLALN